MAENIAVLHEQVALVTGGGRGIGAAIAAQLSKMGAITVITGRNRDPLNETAGRIRDEGGKCEPIECDVTDLPSVERLAQQVSSRFGRLDILVNNAGIGSFSTPLHQLPPEQWDAVLNTNLRGPYYMIRALAPIMVSRQGGHIINISSLAGKNPVPNASAYAASKWGLNGLSYSVAEELRAYKIRVSVICPGSVFTDMMSDSRRDTAKMLRPSDVAHVVAMIVTQAPQSFASEVLLRPTEKP